MSNPPHLRSLYIDRNAAAFDEIAPCPRVQHALRRARASGMILGAALSLIVFSAGIVLRAVIEANWPVACDGARSLIACGLKLIGVLN